MRQVLFGTLATALLLLAGCNDPFEIELQERVTGMRPVYAAPESIRQIEMQPPRPLKRPGKIYTKGQRLYVGEAGEGVHIIDNSDPSNPAPVSFLQIPGNVDIAIKGDILYADNYTDLVAIAIGEGQDPMVLHRQEGLYELPANRPGNGYSGYFECVDPSKGIVVAWQLAELSYPECYQ